MTPSIVLHKSVKEENFHLTYTLFQGLFNWEEKEILGYSIQVAMEPLQGPVDKVLIEQVTTQETLAIHILHKLAEHLVTPMTALDCIYNLIVEPVAVP